MPSEFWKATFAFLLNCKETWYCKKERLFDSKWLNTLVQEGLLSANSSIIFFQWWPSKIQICITINSIETSFFFSVLILPRQESSSLLFYSVLRNFAFLATQKNRPNQNKKKKPQTKTHIPLSVRLLSLSAISVFS